MLIGITGKSGEGKSTLARNLVVFLPNAIAIHGDIFSFPSILSQREKLIELYGEDIIYEDKLNMKLYIEDLEKVRKIRELSTPILCAKLSEQLKEAEKQYKNIIIEWARLPEIVSIWNKCDECILVKSEDDAKRCEHLTYRHKDATNPYITNSGTVTLQQLKKRDLAVVDYEKYTYSHIITNHYDSKFYQDIKKLAETLAPSFLEKSFSEKEGEQ